MNSDMVDPVSLKLLKLPLQHPTEIAHVLVRQPTHQQQQPQQQKETTVTKRVAMSFSKHGAMEEIFGKSIAREPWMFP